jgi:chorismate dehydratase
LARVPYLNSAVFFRGSPLEGKYHFVDCPPRQLGEKAAAGEVASGLLPAADFLRLRDRFEPLGHVGIAVRGRVKSVLLFAKRPIRQLGGATIAVTQETSTSAVLLRLILERRYELEAPTYIRGTHPEAEALLLIGDEALKFQKTNTQYPFEIDLAFEWWLWQHLPFVLALWAIRTDADPQERKQIEAGLMRALTVNSGQLELIAQEASPKLGIPAEELHAYLKGIVYRFSPAEDEGLAKFAELAKEMGTGTKCG